MANLYEKGGGTFNDPYMGEGSTHESVLHRLNNPEVDRDRLSAVQEAMRGYDKTMTSYSGADISASIRIPGKTPMTFGEIYAVGYSINRPKTPVVQLGSSVAKGFTSGVRMITGLLAFNVFRESIVLKAMNDITQSGYLMLMDEMPLFDIVIVAANEYGSKSTMTIEGVTVVNEGQSMSIDDMKVDNINQFYALNITPWRKLGTEGVTAKW